MKGKTKISIFGVAISLPFITMAATFSSILSAISALLCQSIGILFVLATVAFLWGVVQYVLAGGDEDKIASGREFMIYGLIGLFVMVAMWGIVNAAVTTFFSTGVAGGSECSIY